MNAPMANATIPTRELTLSQAINEALRQEMQRDSSVILLGEDVAGAAGRAHLGLVDAWGGGRCGHDRITTRCRSDVRRPDWRLLRSDHQSGRKDALHDGRTPHTSARHPHCVWKPGRQTFVWRRGGGTTLPDALFGACSRA